MNAIQSYLGNISKACATDGCLRYGAAVGVKIDAENDKVTLTATDGRILSKVTTSSAAATIPAQFALEQSPNSASSAIVSAQAFQKAARGANKVKGWKKRQKALAFSLNESVVTFANNDGATTAEKPIEGRFPNTEQYIEDQKNKPVMAKLTISPVLLRRLLDSMDDGANEPAMVMEIVEQQSSYLTPVIRLTRTNADGVSFYGLLASLSPQANG